MFSVEEAQEARVLIHRRRKAGVLEVWVSLHGDSLIFSPRLAFFRYGNDLEQSQVMGIAQALISTAADMNDSFK